MLKITRFTCENLRNGCVTDERKPCFSFSLESDRENTALEVAEVSVNGWKARTKSQIAIPYEGAPLQPFTAYTAKVTATDTAGDSARASVSFETGRLGTPWQGQWISDGAYSFTEKRISPKPMTFRKIFSLEKRIVSAKIYATAMGIYELVLNGEKVGNEYFAPGFTSYKTHLQYQTYDVTDMLLQENTLVAAVGGGWAVGAFVFTRKNRISAKRQALLLELRVTYADGTEQVIGTDESWEVTEEGNYREADIYDGETYDATVDLSRIAWRPAALEKLRISPDIVAAYGAPVRAQEQLDPVSCNEVSGGLIYDFGQNFAGVVNLRIRGRAGQLITVKHAEILNPDGTLNTTFLRTAKACATYICRDGEQVYSPRLTYMGFRYVCITGIGKEELQVSAWALYSEIEKTGEFFCSNELVNRLQDNILWSSKSNFIDIPTDCPQRDERMGWTGDIAIFAPTACYNFDMSRFLGKWLLDVAAEQRPTGGIPNTVPAQGYGFPATMPTMAVDFWGDACVLVPWAEYCARGDKRLLKKCYPMMKKYVDACKFWAGLLSIGKHRYIWITPYMLHFGDWVAPDVPKMSEWQKRSKWTATASLRNTSGLVAKIADILGEKEDAKRYASLSEKVAGAYRALLSDGNGRMKKEFQTAYVLPLQFGIFKGREKEEAVKNLVRLVKKSDYCIGTGFPGTPYVLFALADNGYAEVAYRMLLNTKCPSWLYEVRMGATTIWERWDGLDEDGVCPIGEDGTDLMISYNHYASGAVGDFLYRRIAGIEAMEAGYKKFRISPVPGGDIRYARGSVETPYGRVSSDWRLEKDSFYITVEVPVGTACELKLPDGNVHILPSGKYSFEAKLS
ncbi:MAG TPA: family 78 glycoside hydrolase catalytic domain [Clostridiales bacterium]|nr:family 78 glycoside hydrolase catalytic domain [Clostridiales bacterium]